METNLNLYEIQIVKEYNGSKVDDKALVAKVIGKDETFHLFILPNYQERWVRFGCDSNTEFAQQVTQLMMESGEAEHLIKQVYDNCFGVKIEGSLNTLDMPANDEVTYTLLK